MVAASGLSYEHEFFYTIMQSLRTPLKFSAKMKSRTPITFQRPNRTMENTIERAARATESREIVMPFLIYSNCQAI